MKHNLPKLRKTLPSKTVCSGSYAQFSDQSDHEDETEDVEKSNASKSRFLSRKEFVTYMLARRGDITRHRIVGTGKLYCQFVLHCYSRLEADRLSAIGLHRTEIRSSSASSLFKYLDSKLYERGIKLGKLVNFPRPFVGSRNWYQNLYSNAMAVAPRIGKPDLFITFTGSQEWPEIKENLPGKFDTWVTEPMLCARVFFQRMWELKKDIIERKIFGEVTALQMSVEFQKRGMPHAHILVTLKNKLNPLNDIDEYISAEIPILPKPGLACRRADPNKCEKKFPKAFCEDTEITSNGYPLYRRRKRVNVPIGKQKTKLAGNEHVVPYNPYLLLKYRCHINVGACSSLQSFKYIFKYIFKGHDQILFEILQNKEVLNNKLYRDTEAEIVNETLKSSPIWKMLKVHILDQNMRLASGENEYAECLLSIGEGRNFMSDEIHVELPKCICLPTEKDVLEWMYSDEVVADPEQMGKMVLLSIRNCDVLELNELVLQKVAGETVELTGIDTPLTDEDGVRGMPCESEEFLHQFTPTGMPKYKLRLKVGAIIMLLKNLDISEVRLSYCMTVNKSQGQTFEKLGVILRTPSFAHGSTYVALFRVRTQKNIRVIANWGTPMPEKLKIRNVVYADIMED
ncbi:hypothetical protein ANCCAN_16467 [Ancylostoma caninum]|uniref:Uncharacterized protein n=1 Tax=Ancylostoma caninum TaxID=29170 RepID=A0A368G1P5_ANCCA|nr:hypothetical protein ANCCAN_16467 [Ancylostoma caninum]